MKKNFVNFSIHRWLWYLLLRHLCSNELEEKMQFKCGWVDDDPSIRVRNWMYLFIEMILFFDHPLMEKSSSQSVIVQQQRTMCSSTPSELCQATREWRSRECAIKNIEWQAISVNCKQISFAIMMWIHWMGEMMQNVNRWMDISVDSHSYWKARNSSVSVAVMCFWSRISPKPRRWIRELSFSCQPYFSLFQSRCNEKHASDVLFPLWCALFKIQSCCKKWISEGSKGECETGSSDDPAFERKSVLKSRLVSPHSRCRETLYRFSS